MWTLVASKCKDMISHWRDYPLPNGKVWLGRYRIEHFIGRGSYGQAYACSDMVTGHQVLLKRSMPSKKETGKWLLERESLILQQLNHPQIPKWLRYVKQGRHAALVMELVAGDNLEHKLMEQGETYSLKQSLTVIKELLQPLAYLHQAGYVHRDVRIPNVMDQGGRLYLIDYGLSCRIGEQLPAELRSALKEMEPIENDNGRSSSWSGAKRHMRRPEPASDLFGLGHLFLFMMYAGYEYREGQPELSWEEDLELPPTVKMFVRRLLQQSEPGWQSAEHCKQELEQLIAALPD
ncbi:protein kinase family protein [Bacillus sp. FJAT-26390]|uniref:serine/threonine protein kinase n=1 Tax=Bacillus sp. FJAT-26390 TaxID=1743142 RepID=UPI000807DE52|nr:protein kinase family protein [Bacillus sp. FJAT-26390]OBZ11180.1 serine/threonine protein kinase [Bacillus sp. FJAT-26390]